MENSKLDLRVLCLLVFLLLSYSCGQEVKKNYSPQQWVSTGKNDECFGDESVFNAYLFSNYDKQKFYYIDPHFSNSYFKKCISEKNYNTGDEDAALIICKKYFDLISFRLMISNSHKGTVRNIGLFFDELLYEELKIEKDSVSQRIANLYEGGR